jgi:hypothetical protein
MMMPTSPLEPVEEQDVNASVASQTDASSALRELLPLWGWTLAVSLLGTWTCFLAQPGINWPLLTAAACAGLAVMARRAGPQQPGVHSAVALLLAVLISGAACVTADPYSIGLIIGSLAALALYAVHAIMKPADMLDPLTLAVAPFTVLAATVLSACRRGREAGAAARKPGFLPFLRGPAMALALAVPLFLLLSAADPTLGDWRDQIGASVMSGDFGNRAIFFVTLGAAFLGIYGLVERSTRDAQWVAGPQPGTAGQGALAWRFSDIERLMVLATAAALFVLFFTAEASTRYGLHGAHVPEGMTLAEATHRGFTEMIIAAGLCALVIINLDSHALRGPRERLARVLAWAVIAASLLVVMSAYERVLYYEEAYGYTRLRLYVKVCCAAVSLALLLLAWELRGPVHVARLTRHVGMSALLFAAVLAYWNGVDWIVQANVDRLRQTGRIDAAYLSQLADSSPDAVPALVASLPQLTAADAARLRGVLRGVAPRRETAWYEWNLRRNVALSTLCMAGLLPGSADTACPGTAAARRAAEPALPTASSGAPPQPAAQQSGAQSVP